MTGSARPRLVLFSPNPIVGGTEVIFARFGERASSRGWEVCAVDQRGGAFVPLLQSRRDAAGVAVSRDDVQVGRTCIVTTPKFLGALADARHRWPADSRVLIHQVHPYEWVSALFPGFFRISTAWGEAAAIAWIRLLSLSRPGHRSTATRLLEFFGRSGALATMDGPCRDATARFLASDGDTTPAWSMPVVALPTETGARGRLGGPDARTLRAAYFGRVSDFKTASVVRVIEDLARSPRATATQLHVIGDGDGMPAARAAASRVASTGLCVVFHGALPLGRAQAFLGSQADLVFAMGSSALDAAVLGLPVYLVNPLRKADRRVPVFGGWLCDQLDASLGAYEPTRYSSRPLSIPDAVEELGERPDIARLCLDYVQTVHDAATGADLLLDLASASSLTLQEYASWVEAVGGGLVKRRRQSLALEVVKWPSSC